ncbi:PglZ domain-containing protein [Spirillospora sp. NPDC047279]|uniref:PglZ domain-containing protein n=1 Tax=Spirillospora sp. NPDC047279 TaxID=3155478 RepID=UPI0033EA14F1
MHPLHDYIAKLLADKLNNRKIVVWYDQRSEFTPFINEVRNGPRIDAELAPVSVGGVDARLAEYDGSMFEVRAAAEPYVSGDTPGVVVIYLPGCARDARSSVLMELEEAGTRWNPGLVQLARNLLLKTHTLGVVDQMLAADRKLTYTDLARMAESDGPEPPSILKTIFHDARDSDAMLGSWLTDESHDAAISAKAATPELVALINAKLGLDPPGNATLSKLRAVTARYVLASEFRLDLACPPPASLEGVPTPPSAESASAVRALATRLRVDFSAAYPALADQVENDLRLRETEIPASALGSTDTFRFEERELLRYCADLIVAAQYDEVLAIVTQREHCFWLKLDVGRRAQWEAVRRMAELGREALRVRAEVGRANGNVRTWLMRYTDAPSEWYRLDQAQRQLEAWVATLDDDPDERLLGLVRRAYEDTCHLMAAKFVDALSSSHWAIPDALHQTHVYGEVVAEQPKPVAYFLVDAMRYEMGVELASRLPESSELSVRPGVAALPSITPVGMAALQPGASASFSVVEEGDRFGARINSTFLPDLTARQRYLRARIPKSADLSLAELLSLAPSKLTKKLDDAQVVVVRSQEIDKVGEAGFTFHARQVMDTVIDNIARAIRKLAAAGVGHAVVTADHGHLFFASDRDESMRTDPPGGRTVDLHRRCWIGHGGATPPGCVRVTGSALGYDSDLELVFPAGAGVFRAGGDLAFHHGGPTLQEMVIPVVTIRTAAGTLKPDATASVTVTDVPEVITNRIFTVTLSLGSGQMMLGTTGTAVRAMLISNGNQVGMVGMVAGAEFDRATERIQLESDSATTVGFQLSDDTADSLQIVVLDPETDAELFRSRDKIPVRLGVR